MATFSQMQGWLKNITYKPGYRFALHEDPWERGTTSLRIIAQVPDSRGLEGDIPLIAQELRHKASLPRSKKEFVEWAGNVIRNMELHEVDEWFKVDGGHVKHPHPEMLRSNLYSDGPKS